MSVEFEDNTVRIKEALTSGIISFLLGKGGEICARAQRNSRVDTGKTMGSYKYVVDEGEHESTVEVGSDMENAIWEEFGTGEYALHGDGRKGGWRYQDEKGQWHFTRGKKPNQPLTRAFRDVQPKIESGLAEIIRENMGE